MPDKIGLIPPPLETVQDPALLSYLDRNFQTVERALVGLQRRVFGTYGVSTVSEAKQTASQVLSGADSFTPGLSIVATTDKANCTGFITISWEIAYIPGGGEFNGKIQIFTPGGGSFLGNGLAKNFEAVGTTARRMCTSNWVFPMTAIGSYTIAAIHNVVGGSGTVQSDPNSKMSLLVMESP